MKSRLYKAAVYTLFFLAVVVAVGHVGYEIADKVAHPGMPIF